MTGLQLRLIKNNEYKQKDKVSSLCNAAHIQNYGNLYPLETNIVELQVRQNTNTDPAFTS